MDNQSNRFKRRELEKKADKIIKRHGSLPKAYQHHRKESLDALGLILLLHQDGAKVAQAYKMGDVLYSEGVQMGSSAYIDIAKRALKEEFGFGDTRIERFLSKCSDIAKASIQKEVGNES